MQKNFFSDYGNGEGIIFDCNRGIYNMANVINLAFAYGFKDDELKEGMTDDEILKDEFCADVTADAEEFLTALLPDGFWFGYNENGDVGIFKDEDEDGEEINPSNP